MVYNGFMERKTEVQIDTGKCSGCGSCVADCQRDALAIQNGKAAILNPECLMCGHCLAVCPENAVTLMGYNDRLFDMPESSVFLNADALLTHLRFRRSIRQFRDTPVEKEKLEKIIEAGRLSPTASNLQNVRYLVIQNGIDALEDDGLLLYRNKSDLLDGLAARIKVPVAVVLQRLKRGFLFHGAKALVLVVSPSEINGSLAAMTMELMAQAQGLGVVHVALFTRPANTSDAIRQALGLEKDENMVACLALGYPHVKYYRSVPRKNAAVIWR